MANKLFVDSIALQIEILDKTTNKLSSKLYILYDTNSKKYIIRGCNYIEIISNLNDTTLEDIRHEYSFECYNKMSIFEFINIIISKNYSTISLLNYKRMYVDLKLITYKYLNRASIFDRNKCVLSSKTHEFENMRDILHYLSIIKDFTNNY